VGVGGGGGGGGGGGVTNRQRSQGDSPQEDEIEKRALLYLITLKKLGPEGGGHLM